MFLFKDKFYLFDTIVMKSIQKFRRVINVIVILCFIQRTAFVNISYLF